MIIEFLQKQDFIEVENIEELKISKGKVEFDKDGGTSKIIEPDLRYFWDGERFGLHASNWDYYIIKDLLQELERERVNDLCEVLYLAESNISEFAINDTSFEKLKFLDLSRNNKLRSITLSCLPLNGLPLLDELIANDCPQLQNISLNGNYPNLRKIDLSNCSVENFIFSNVPQLEYLNIQNNKIEALNISFNQKLTYLFAQKNENLTLVFPANWNLNKLSILGIDKSNKKISKDIIELARTFTDQELQKRIKSFLQLWATSLESSSEYSGETILNRQQIVLIGNTTSGKTELKYRFLNIKRPSNEHSTHGVQLFKKNVDGENEVIGFDFGGQDYYHALHIPFFDDESHFILVWGNHTDKTWGSYDSDKYYGKSEEVKVEGLRDKINVNNLLFPINYWLESINSNYSNPIKDEILSSKIEHENERLNTNVRKVDIIQNIPKGCKEQYLNIRDLKSRKDLDIEEIKSFDFKHKKLGNWLTNRVKNLGSIQKNPILISVKVIGEKLANGTKALFKKKELEEYIKEEFPELSRPKVQEFIESLRRNRYIYYPGHLNEKLAGFYIIHIEKFSQFIYQVLNKELATSDQNQGYFYKKDALQRIKHNDKEVKEYVLRFLINSEIIFEIAGSNQANPKYLAPTYLSSPKDKVELLFIESFEKPVCEFEFNDFFHPNLMLQVVKEYYEKNLLVKDEEVNEYLIWKNCVIIYNNQSSKNYLKLELVLPNEEYPDRIPKFTISRSNAGFIPNDQFKLIFSEIKKSLAKYNPIIRVKTAFDTYIDLKDVESANNLVEGKNKKSQFVYSNGVLYPKYDFRHFCGDSFEAPIKIFVAYSKADDLYRLELRDHLLPGINEGKFIVFDDREMDLGEKWHARLKKELEQCDIFIVLVSVKLLGTAYVMNIEIPEAKARIEKGNLEKIVPIMVSPCDWTKTGLSDLNVHDKAQSITLEDISGELGINERAAKWSEIVKEIEKFKTSNSNGTNPPNSPSSPDEHHSGTAQTNV